MFSTSEIEKRKELFKLPFKRDQLEYWGPVTHVFADSFLTMGYKFLNQYFDEIGRQRLKSIFSSFVEMVQNVAEYNEKEFKDNYPQSYVKFKTDNKQVIINTANVIKDENLVEVRTIFEKIFSLDEDGLKIEHDKMLMNGGSLGLIMLKRLKDSSFEYIINKDEYGINWLSLELIINYGNT